MDRNDIEQLMPVNDSLGRTAMCTILNSQAKLGSVQPHQSQMPYGQHEQTLTFGKSTWLHHA